MRGKGGGRDDAVRQLGITPAYAGKSKNACVKKVYAGDHPRLCGEKDVADALQGDAAGITPAYAGKSTRRKPHTDLA